jgi:methyl-accepting chemotaxis protein PixJ
MLNRMNKAKSNDDQQDAVISSSQNTDVAQGYQGNSVLQYIAKLSLKKKAAILAIAITTLPTFVMGAIAYRVAHKSLDKQIYLSHETTATKLAEDINRLMSVSARDIQTITDSPFFTNSRVNRNTTNSDKRAFLDSFVKSHQAYSSISIFDRNGKLIVQSSDAQQDNSQNPADLQKILEKDVAVISQPKNSVINITAPIKDVVTETTIAVAIFIIPVQFLQGVMQDYTNSSIQSYLLDSNNKVFFPPKTELFGGEFPGLSDLIQTQRTNVFTTIHSINQEPKLLSYVSSGTLQGSPGLNWRLILATDTKVAFARQRQLLSTMAIATILLALILGAIAVWLSQKITKPILNASGALAKLAQGEFHTRWQSSRQDELGIISQNFNQIAAQLQVLTQQQALSNSSVENSDPTVQMQLIELVNHVESAAKGDLTVRAEVTAGQIGTIADFFNSIVENLRDIVTQVKQTASQVNQAIGADEAAIHQLAAETLTQVSEINRTLDAVDKMTDFMKSVAENAQKAAIIANNAAQSALRSGAAMDLTVENILGLRETVGDTAQKVKRLGESSQQISHVVSLINQIATQTNLLAINASIEAARAGEEAQGFVVIAEEVGELAIRSAAATQEIEEIIANIQRETNEVVQAMEIGTSQVMSGTEIVAEAKQSLKEILDVSQQIDFLVQSISHATASQLQTSQAVSELIQDIAAISERTSNSSSAVSQSLHETVEISQQLQASVETFKVN